MEPPREAHVSRPPRLAEISAAAALCKHAGQSGILFCQFQLTVEEAKSRGHVLAHHDGGIAVQFFLERFEQYAGSAKQGGTLIVAARCHKMKIDDLRKCQKLAYLVTVVDEFFPT